MTGEAVRALATVDVFLVADQGDAPADLVAARQAVCAALIPADTAYRVVEVPDPDEGRTPNATTRHTTAGCVRHSRARRHRRTRRR